MRVLILSDIHGNLEALDAVLNDAGHWDQLWNLGDIVGYGGSPNQVIDRLRPLATLNVRGNHDRVCCGLSSPNGFNAIARAAALWTRDELTADNLAWLREVPRGPLLTSEEGVSCAHGSPLDEDHYILNMRDAWVPLQQMKTTLTFFGHTHVQGGFLRHEHAWHEIHPAYRTPIGAESWLFKLPSGTRQLVNPGSVGQPRDFDWRAGYTVFDTTEETVTFHRIPYDVTRSEGRILMAGLPERLAVRLREGR